MWITQSSCSEPQAATETVAKSLFLIKSSDSSNTPANTTSYISSNGQIAIPNLRITTASRAEWFSVTVPASTTGTMVVTDQSATQHAESLALAVQARPETSNSDRLGQLHGLRSNGELFAGRCAGRTDLPDPALGNAAGNPTGGFGLEVNFGSATQPPIAPPNTVVLQQPDQRGVVSATSVQFPTGPQVITIGNLARFTYGLLARIIL